MLSKLDILNKVLPNGIAEYGAYIDRKIVVCMDEHAKQMSIGFAEWKWRRHAEKYTTEQLYATYIEQLNQP